jgi:RNA polymerase sigma-70 factor, ECF subfamily
MSSEKRTRDDWYQEAVAAYGRALGRIARAYELDSDKRRDLLQEIHLSLWRSFGPFEIRERRAKLNTLVTLEEIDNGSEPTDHRQDTEQRIALERLLRLIHQLRPIHRQVMLLYLEEMDSASQKLQAFQREVSEHRFTGSKQSWLVVFIQGRTMNNPSPNDPRHIWQTQETETITMSAKQIRDSMLQLHGRNRGTNAALMVVFASIGIYYGLQAFEARGMLRTIACMLISTGNMYWTYHQRR